MDKHSASSSISSLFTVTRIFNFLSPNNLSNFFLASTASAFLNCSKFMPLGQLVRADTTSSRFGLHATTTCCFAAPFFFREVAFFEFAEHGFGFKSRDNCIRGSKFGCAFFRAAFPFCISPDGIKHFIVFIFVEKNMQSSIASKGKIKTFIRAKFFCYESHPNRLCFPATVSSGGYS